MLYSCCMFVVHGDNCFLLYASPVGCKSMSQIDVDDNWEVGSIAI